MPTTRKIHAASYPASLVAVLTLLIACIAAVPVRAREALPAGTPYTAETRAIVSSGISRSFVLAYPATLPTGVALPLVVSLHGDGGNGAAMRAALPLEAHASSGAVFVYPDAPGGSFEYWSDAGRSREVIFVADVIAAMQAEFGIDTQRVYLAGFSGGATMANALGCRLGAGVIRGLGINSGSLYPVNGDFDYTADGGVSCALPSAIIVWGMADTTPGVDFATGEAIRDNFRQTLDCDASATAWPPAPPCVAYDHCARALDWCPISGMGHAIWSGAAAAMWTFFDDPILRSGFEAGALRHD